VAQRVQLEPDTVVRRRAARALEIAEERVAVELAERRAVGIGKQEVLGLRCAAEVSLESIAQPGVELLAQARRASAIAGSLHFAKNRSGCPRRRHTRTGRELISRPLLRGRRARPEPAESMRGVSAGSSPNLCEGFTPSGGPPRTFSRPSAVTIAVRFRKARVRVDLRASNRKDALMQIVTDTLQALLPYYPATVRAEIASSIDTIGLEAIQLAAEVMRAERDGIPFHVAANRMDFPLLGRVHHGMADFLRHRVPRQVRETLQKMAAAAQQDAFEEVRLATFTCAQGDGPEAALTRFFIYEGVRLNLLVLTWDDAAVEALGCLDTIDRTAQECVADFLRTVDPVREGVRPLHVLVTEMFLRMMQDYSAMRAWVRQSKEVFQAIESLIDATAVTRKLDAKDAAVVRGQLDELGSQEIADRYPWHFATAGAVDQRRSRLTRRLSGGRRLKPSRDRLIDILRDGLNEVIR